jgi:hypothetical protein
MITLQAFLHFLKTMNLANSRNEVIRLLECLHELIRMPVSDSLNLTNGLNYSQFLEALLRIAYYKLDESELSQ